MTKAQTMVDFDPYHQEEKSEKRGAGLPRPPTLTRTPSLTSSECSDNSSSEEDDCGLKATNQSLHSSTTTLSSQRRKRKEVRFQDSSNRTISIDRLGCTNDQKMEIWYTGGDFAMFHSNFKKSRSESTLATMSSASSSSSSSSSSRSSSSSLTSILQQCSTDETDDGEARRRHRPMETYESFNGSDSSRRNRKAVSRSVLLHQNFYRQRRRQNQEDTNLSKDSDVVDPQERLCSISCSLSEQSKVQALQLGASNAHESKCFLSEDLDRYDDTIEYDTGAATAEVTSPSSEDRSSCVWMIQQYMDSIHSYLLSPFTTALSKMMLCNCE